MDDFKSFYDDLLKNRKKCPWSRVQKFDDILPYLDKEVAELKSARINRDNDNLKEEMGDVLWDILFLAIIAEEEFDIRFSDVVKASKEKLRRRKPWVFSDMKVDDAADAMRLWNEAKKKEKEMHNERI
jgi:uncharacterized protein YabN with tetrapyrrole methylase and pyrophosphatase domain